MLDQLGWLPEHLYSHQSVSRSVGAFYLFLQFMSCQDKQLKTGSVKHIDSKILAEHKKKEREAGKKRRKPNAASGNSPPQAWNFSCFLAYVVHKF